MGDVKMVGLTPTLCNKCGHLQEVALGDPGRGPRDGDIALCFSCGHPSFFRGEGPEARLEPMSDAEVDALEPETILDILAALADMAQVRRSLEAKGIDINNPPEGYPCGTKH